MKLSTVVIFLMMIQLGCNQNAEMEKRTSELQAKQNELQQELASRDEYIENVTRSIDDVYGDLESIRSKEKLVMAEGSQMEAAKKPTSEEVRQHLLAEIASIDTAVHNSRRKMEELQSKVNSYRAQFASLRTLVSTLRKRIDEREASIAELEQKVKGLESEVGQKSQMISERDSVIGRHLATIEEQTRQLNTGFYVVGSRRELENMGIIKSEGGFLWGLLGSTTVLASGFNRDHFKPISKWDEKSIEIPGTVSEIIPKRDPQYYSMNDPSKNESVLTILEPTKFWQESYLVIITN